MKIISAGIFALVKVNPLFLKVNGHDILLVFFSYQE